MARSRSKFLPRHLTALFFVLISAAFAMIVVSPVKAVDVFSNTSAPDGTPSTVNATVIRSVGFTVPGGNDYTLNSLTLQLANPGASARSVTPALYDDSSGHPGTLIQTFDAMNLAGSAASASYTSAPSAAVTLTNGTTYWIVVSASNNSSWEGTNPLQAPSGTFTFVGYRTSSNAGSTWASTASPQNKVGLDATENIPNTPTNTPTNTPPSSSSGGSSAASAPAEVFQCENLEGKTDGAMTASGGSGDVQVNGVYGNVFCRVIVKNSAVITKLAEIGVRSVIDQGVVQAVDLFGLLPDGSPVVPLIYPIRVCLRGQGSVVLLSAADVARMPSWQPADPNSPSGYTCASIPVSGTVVLVGVFSSSTPSAPSALQSANVCEATTTAMVHLRQEASTDSAVLADLPYQITLSVTAQVPGWYQVIYLNMQGWVSADFVTTSSNCG